MGKQDGVEKKHYCRAFDKNDKSDYGCQRCPGKNKDLDWSDVHFTSFLCFRI
ncbi:MAG: hypothetical protein PHW62_00425 [Candidatus Ratteibacteria bacterium]|nr:hypothetical protein [Candidatus Ratteibacteria bacterium]